MPSQKLSSDTPVEFDPARGSVPKVMLPEVTGVLGNALTTTEVMMPQFPEHRALAKLIFVRFEDQEAYRHHHP
jgi:hypothetical protein